MWSRLALNTPCTLAGLQLAVTLLPQLPQAWGERCSPHTRGFYTWILSRVTRKWSIYEIRASDSFESRVWSVNCISINPKTVLQFTVNFMSALCVMHLSVCLSVHLSIYLCIYAPGQRGSISIYRSITVWPSVDVHIAKQILCSFCAKDDSFIFTILTTI